jgi:hypothetical protein
VKANAKDPTRSLVATLPQESWGIDALSLTYQFFASTLFQVQIRCRMELEASFNRMIPDLEPLPHEA